MPWYFPWSDSIKKRACRYLLQRYLGHFLKEKLTLDQLSVDLYNGKGTIKDLLLDVVSLNEALDSFNVPFEIVDGFIGSITVDIPWSMLVNDNTHVEINNLELTVQPKQRDDRAGVMLESMFASMTSSLELAQECLRQEPTEGEQQAETAQPFDGLEMFAMTIEAVLARIKMSFTDTVVRLEHLPKDAQTGAALELRIARAEYFDDLATDPGSSVDRPDSSGRSQPVFDMPAIAHKNIHLMGVTLFCDEFPATHRTVSRLVTVDAQENTAGKSPDISVSPPLLNLHFDDREATPDTSVVKDAEPIKIAVLMGKQELQLKIKQNDELPGPKMDVECQLGILNIHLSPRQVHLLLEIAHGLTTPDACDQTNVRPRKAASRPMDPEDEEKVEQELQKRLQSSRVQRYTHLGPGWPTDEPFSTQPLDDSEDEVYFDLDSQSVSCSMTSSLSSVSTNRSTSTTSSFNYMRREAPFQSTIPRSGRSKPRTKHKESLHKLLDDTTADLFKCKLKISFLSAMILHEDPPTTPGDALDPGQTSTEKLQVLAEKYFSRVHGINTSGYNTTLENLRQEFSGACPLDHISVLGKPVTVECNQRCSSAALSTTVEVIIGQAEIIEALFDRHRGVGVSLKNLYRQGENISPDYCELLTFLQDELPKTQMFSSMHTTTGPAVRIKVTSAEKTHQSPRRHSSSSQPRTDLHIELAKCVSEVDISLVDRIHALLNPQPLARPKPANQSVYVSAYKSFTTNTQSQHAMFSQALDEGVSSSSKPVDLRLSCPNVTFIVRFPVPDLRSGQGVDKPWWRRCLREERFVLRFTDADFQTSIQQGEQLSKLEFTCREGSASLQERTDQPPVPFIYVTKADGGLLDRDEGFDWPRIEVKLFAKLQSQLEEVVEEAEDSSNMDSLNGACQFEAQQPSPFSSKKVLYDNDEMVLPGNRQETSVFQEKSLSQTELSVDLTLPNVNIYLPSKHFFELIYNRLLNDLVLWEPVAPSPIDVQEPYSFAQGPGWSIDTVTPFMQQHGTETFSMCKSGIQYDSSSDSDDDGLNEFYSAAEFRSRQRQKQNQNKGRKSKMCLTLSIGRGRLSAVVPYKDADSLAMCGCHGEICLDVVDGLFFTVVQTNGDPELQHMCIHVHEAALHHKGDVADHNEPYTLTRAPPTLVPPGSMIPTMYLSDSGIDSRLAGQVGCGSDTQDMVSIAVQVKIDLLTNVEECLVALGVKGTTLLHRATPTGLSWFDQLVEFFDVKEYPVLGYAKPQVITQLHAHLWSCSIDYRPLFLPYKTLVTLETFSISSNVVAESPTSKLRFLVEDGALYISQTHHKHKDLSEVNLRRDYVCVADVGVFELTLTSSDGRDPKYPKLDLRVSNNILHIRTCSDSCRALAELINYIAENKDLNQSADGSSSYASSILGHSTSSSTLSESPQITQTHMEQVHDMMADAMKESPSSSHNSKDSTPETNPKEATEVFFFPGEDSVKVPLHQTTSTTPPVMNPATQDSDPSPPDSPIPSPGSSSLSSSPLMPYDASDSDDDSIERSLSQLEVTSGTVEPVLAPGSTVVLGQGAALDHFGEEAEFSGEEEGKGNSGDDEFCIIDDPGLGIAPRDGEPRIRVFIDEPIQITENYFQIPLGKMDQLQAPKHFPDAVCRYTLQEMSLVWYMYAGKDFSHSKQAKSGASKSTSGAKQRQSMGKLVWQARGGPDRDINTLLELQLSKVRLRHEVYPETSAQASRQILLINELEIRDRLASSKINKFLYHFTSDTHPRQSHANMVLVKALHLRPEANLPSQECSVRVSLQPLRLNIDQDALFFLRTFFIELSGNPESLQTSDIPDSPKPASGPMSTPQRASAPPPVMSVGSAVSETEENPQDLVKFDEMLEEALGDEDSESGLGDVEGEGDRVREQPVFFKSFMFSPDVPIRLDYHGKRVDMEQGTIAGLLVGLAQLNCSELRLKRLHHRHGLLGFDRLMLFAMNEWLKDIKRNQLPSILGGVGPMHSLVQLARGIKDLFWLPVEQYRKDGRIIRGLQRGAHSFATCTAMSALELTNRVVQTVQYCAEVAYDMVSPGPSVRKKKYRRKMKRLTHPADLREGVSNAYSVVTEGLKSTAETIYHTAVDEHEQKGVTGAVGGVLRQLPPSVLQPVIIATEATSNVLGGMRNQLLPDKKKEDEEKWKPEEES